MTWATTTARRVRRDVFETFAREGRAPSPPEVAVRLGLDEEAVTAALRELHDAHAVVLTTAGDAIRMAHPFSAWPMGFVVRAADDRMWWGGCAWDSFGIVAALGERLEILTRCPSTGAELRYAAAPDTAPDADGVVVRIPRPAAQWWDDVVATCTAIRAFSSAAALEDWCTRTGEPAGASVDLVQLWRLAQAWYADRLDPDWAPRPLARSQELLTGLGLDGDFWKLPS